MLPLSANVPAAKLSVPPLATLNEPAHAVVQLPPPEKIRVPAFALTVPGSEDPTPKLQSPFPVICSLLLLKKDGAVPPLKLMPFETLLFPFTMFQVAPA